MDFLAEVPAWGWQVLGAVCGLGLGLVLGAWRLRKRRTAKNRSPVGRPSAARPMPVAGTATTLPAALASGYAEASVSRLPAATQPGALDEAGGPAAIDRLRDANLDLAARLRAATDLHARELLERSQAQQVDQQRHERQIEELRQQHAAELSHLMTVMVEQVDGMQRDHVQQLRTLESEVERLRRQRVGQDAATEISTLPMQSIGAGDAPAVPSSIRRDHSKVG